MRKWLVCTVLAVAVTGTIAGFAAAQESGAPAVPEQATAVAEPAAAAPAGEPGWEDKIDAWFGKWVVDPLVEVLFWDVAFWDNETLPNGKVDKGINLPITVVWLVFGAVFFTLRMKLVNFKLFRHAIRVTRGDYDNPEDEGEVTHFQALVSALSATVGLGNIAGVAIAIRIGGPGATFWMILAGFLGMSAKFVECTLGQKYREVRPDGRIMGGAMYYLSKGLGEIGMAGFGRVLAVIFAVMCIGGAFAGGNAFQVRNSLDAVAANVEFLADHGWIYGLIMTVLVGVVIIGGIKRIAETAEKIVPAMVIIYILACLTILFMNVADIPSAFGEVFSGAFTMDAGIGGFVGVLIVGFQRAAFSNEAGVGSAAIAHAAAKTEYPIREGVVAMLGPFIDTIVICTMTALVIIITGAYDNPDFAYIKNTEGALLTSEAMRQEISWFPYVLSVAVVLFAYSTMISWSYYGERCWAYLFGDGSSMVYRVIFCGFVFLGSIISARNVLEFGDLMILGMAFPNIIGVLFLVSKVARDKDEYIAKLEAGEFKTYK